MSRRPLQLGLLPKILAAGIVMMTATDAVAQSAGSTSSAEDASLDRIRRRIERTAPTGARLNGAPLQMDRSMRADSSMSQAVLSSRASRAATTGREPFPKRRRSMVKATLIGAAIGGGLGMVAGYVYGKETGDGAFPQAIGALGGIGAGVGGVTGFVVALF